MNNTVKEKEISFVLLMAKSLQQNGIPAHRMEESIFTLCKHFHINGDIFTSPGGIIINLGESGQERTHFVKVAYGDLNMEKLDRIDKLYKGVLSDKINVEQALAELTEIQSLKKRYSSLIEVIFFAVSTSSAARVFGGGYAEIIVSAIIGLFIGVLIVFAEYVPRIGNVVLLLSSMFAIAFAKYAGQWFGEYSIDIATITGLIILIPGFSFTVSIIELVNGHPIAGTARFANTIVSLLMIGMGIAIGSQVDKIISIVPSETVFSEIPDWTLYVALVTVPLGFVVLFKAVLKDFIWILLACWCSYFSIKISGNFLSIQLSVFVASFALGIISNLFAVGMNRPVSIMLVPGIILLVPGSLGYKSISALVSSQTLSGIETAFSMTITAIALVSGLVFSNIILSPKRSF